MQRGSSRVDAKSSHARKPPCGISGTPNQGSQVGVGRAGYNAILRHEGSAEQSILALCRESEQLASCGCVAPASPSCYLNLIA